MNKLNTLNKAQLDAYVAAIEKHYGKTLKTLRFDGSRNEEWSLDVNRDGTVARNVKPEVEIELTATFEDETVVSVTFYEDDIEGIDYIEFWAEEIALSA